MWVGYFIWQECRDIFKVPNQLILNQKGDNSGWVWLDQVKALQKGHESFLSWERDVLRWNKQPCCKLPLKRSPPGSESLNPTTGNWLFSPKSERVRKTVLSPPSTFQLTCWLQSYETPSQLNYARFLIRVNCEIIVYWSTLLCRTVLL